MQSNWKRRVIPRWRASAIAASLPECSPTTSTPQVYVSSNDVAIGYIKNKLADWKNDKAVGYAADLLNFAHIPGASDLLREPAEQIVRLGEPVPLPLRGVAERILNINARSDSGIEPNIRYGKRQKLAAEIKIIKERLIENPRDAISLVDVARLYTALGLRQKAQRAIVAATSLAPDHRFVLRSAARFLIHNNETERAIYYLKRSARTQTDPWLLATLVAAQTILGKSIPSLKRAKTIFDSDKFAPIHLSELGSAIATVDIFQGEIRQAKRNFNKALITANDNAVAQAIWATKNFGLQINIKKEWFSDKFSAESNVYKKMLEGEFVGALNASIRWFDDEPFSTRPMKTASFIASILSNFKAAEEFALEGLRLDNKDTELLHNLVFGLAAQNKIEEAVTQLNTAMRIELHTEGAISGHSLANSGMIKYRKNLHHEGENFYRDAIKKFDTEKNSESKALALAFLACEATRAKAPNSKFIVKEATEFISKSRYVAAAKVLSHSSTVTAEPSLNLEKSLITEEKWKHDIAQNVIFLENPNPFKVDK